MPEIGKYNGALRRRILESFTGSTALVSVAVVLTGFLAATILVLAIGRNPAGIYSAAAQVVTGFNFQSRRFNPYYTGEWLVVSMPLILCGLSMAFAARTGLFNIGAEGQYAAGLTAAQFIALYFPPVPALHVIVAVLGGIAAGAVWGGVAGFLKARFKVSEVVATIMMNYIILYLARYLTLLIPGADTRRTPDLPRTARLASAFLSSITSQSRLNYGLFLTLAAIVFFWLVMGRTRLGYALRATGLNSEAARYSGINVKAAVTASMAVSGAFAGLAGAIVSLGSFSYGRVLSGQDGYGFDGIAVALVGNSGAWGTALSGLLFGMLKSAQPLMQDRRIPDEITSIISGVIVVCISLRAGVSILAGRQKSDLTRNKNTDAEITHNKNSAVMDAVIDAVTEREKQ